MKTNLKTVVLRLSALASLGAVALGVVATPAAYAHETPCPLCGMKVVQGTKTQDNEVVLRYGKKKIEYRCVYCAIADAKKYEGDLVVYAPSETKGKPVLLQRASGKWSVVKEADGKLVPDEGAVFVNDFKSHAKCAMLSRAFHTKAGFERYVAANKVQDAKPLTIDQMVEAATKS